MNYERLTQWTEAGAGIILGEVQNYEEAALKVKHQFKKACNKLAEYEDKLESGRLAEFPCAVGDEVWVIDYDEEVVSYVCVGGNSNFLFLSPTVYAGKDITTPKELCNYYFDCYMEDGDDADIVIFPRNKCFTDKEAAEARLRELQEGK